ncbi:class I adenylate-forming enzyme family protein [Paenarthrobacter ureafaciens]|uniref:class I adenylate-forming enzyme family protein n=1 Tax=Paenarthrobacter ureafaciens TaxID=37931 RepID=UPI001FB4DD94|nr:AMP-binding protein [Paenarthrobacter ureafaciens]UOD81623.1 AMP-binding protein [Paenarthrobacter ureafaciens]WNZ04278.1 AMP-binding protein [Paenarthrobacter ureafaciens]
MRTIGDWIRLNSRRNPAREAFVGVDGRVTFGEAAERAWQLARGLRDAGVVHGTGVGVLAGNSVFNAEAFFGTAAAGGVYIAYNWRWAPAELAAGILETEAKVILAEEAHLPLLEEALQILAEGDKELPMVVRQGREIEALRVGTGPIEDVATPESALCIIYTGGSTGTPKGVVLSHRSAMANSINEMYDCGVGSRENERGLIVTPLFHSAGLLCWLVPHFIAGATSVIAEKFTEESVVDLVGRESITNTFMIPNMMRKLMDTGVLGDPAIRKNLKAVHTGAGLLRMPDKQLFTEMLPGTELYFRYGLTEAGPMVTRLKPSDMLDPAVDGSIGTEYFLVEAQLQDPLGQEVAPGELGEICVRGPGIMTGYYGRPDATAEAMLGGWLHTGDLATRDERGYFYFRDRLKEMIKTGGENVYSAEIEQILHMHPSVLEAVVVGVPDPKWDEEVRAVVVLRSGVSVDAAELSAFLRQHLAGYKIPKKMVFMRPEELPRSAAGKLVKSQLKVNLGWNA